jgi:hypothetical protein
VFNAGAWPQPGIVTATAHGPRLRIAFAVCGSSRRGRLVEQAKGDELAGVTCRDSTDWLVRHPLPPGLRAYSVVAYADAADTAPALRPGHRLLAATDPRNDGMVIAGDAILPGSELLAAARADHWDIALPRDRHPNLAVRAMGSGRHYPREALLRATLTWVIGAPP